MGVYRADISRLARSVRFVTSPVHHRRHDMNRTFLRTLPHERRGGGFVWGDGRPRGLTMEGSDPGWKAPCSPPPRARLRLRERRRPNVGHVDDASRVHGRDGAARRQAATSATASTDPTGAHVHVTRHGIWVEVHAPADGSGGGGSSGVPTGCLRRWVPTKFPHHLQPGKVDPDIHSTPMPPSPGPEYVAYYVYCGDTYLDSVWLAPSAFAPAAGTVDVQAIAEQIAATSPTRLRPCT